MRNVKLAFRTLFKTPFVTIVAILSLALGIGANTAIFSLFDEMLLRAMPVRDPGQLVNLSAPGPKPGSQSCGQAGDCDDVFSYPMLKDLQAAAPGGFKGIAAHVSFGANVAYDRQTLNGDGLLVSGSYFPLLGVTPALGRLFGPADDEVVGANYVAVLSYAYWETALGSDPSVLNKTIVVNGESMTIVGVTPRGFRGTTLGADPKVFVPMTMRGLMQRGRDDFENRRSYWAYLFARLDEGTPMERASAAINNVYRPIITDVEAPLQQGMSDQRMAEFRAKQIVLSPGARGQSSLHGEAKLPLIVLLATTGVVLLIACANIANLLLARGASRGMEMAIRLSLGAARRQVLAQLLTESVILALAGGLASLLFAKWTLGLIAMTMPPEASLLLKLHLRPIVLLFAAGLSIATGLLFGMFPALHSTRPDLVSTIRANAGSITSARSASRFRAILVTAQIALSMALLITAGLFLKSLMNVSRVDLGVDVDKVITFSVSPVLNGYDHPRSQVLLTRIEEELGRVPGVNAVTSSMVPLLAGSNWGTDVHVEGFQRGPDIDANARFNEVGPGYFTTLGVPLIGGREFGEQDAKGTLQVAVVNETFAKKFGLGRDAVGKYMGTGRSEDLDMLIVGLVQDAKYSDVKQEIPPLFYTPWHQDSTVGRLSFYVRAVGDPSSLVRTVAGVVKELDPNLPVEELKTMPQQVRENIAFDRMLSSLSASFALLATLLAAVGLYGVLAYTVSQRTREFGVRMALGADAGRVRALVLRHVGVMFLIGGLIGIGGAIAIGRAAQSLLFGMEGHDPLVFGAAAALLGLFAFCAGYLPAHRASRVDPMSALRYE